ncbi:MAG: hypothetical protein WD851_17180 [Pirellulales bacterium]
MSKKQNMPVYSQQLGAIRVAVWESSTDEGRVFQNVTITRSYREKSSEEWKESSSFNGLADLALVREAARLAANFIEQRERELEPNDK